MATTAPAALEVPCPRCAKPLTDPQGLGWCPACGFCKSLEDTKGVAESAPPKPEAPAPINPLAPPQEKLRVQDFVPAWAVILLLGMGMFAAASYGFGRQLPPEGAPRALWTACQIGVGVLLLFIVQFMAVLRLGPKDPTLSFKDVIMPFRLWPQVIRDLPGTQGLLWLGGWALSIIVSACFFIGGLDHFLTYLPGGKNHPDTVNKGRR